jgi:hypothetical protein
VRALVLAVVCALVPLRAAAADLTDAAIRAYDEYFAAARQAFVAGTAASREDGVVRPGSGDGILSKPDSLVHHWRGDLLLRGVTLDAVIAVSQAYEDYPRIFKPIRAAMVLSASGDTRRVQFRMRASGGGLSATLDVRSRIQWVRPDERHAYVVSTSEEIREVADAGKPAEHPLPEGHDSGYLWRAASMTRFTATPDGVWMTMETVGLSRPFPPMIGWILQPIARRVGRGSVGESMKEFAQAVAARGKLAP